MATQPIIAFSRRTLDHLSERFRTVVEALPEDHLNWRPGDATTNSVAQLVRHVAAEQRLILGLALGEQRLPELDERSRGLHNDPASHAELCRLLAQADAQREEDLARLDGLDLGDLVRGPGNAPHPRFFWVAHSTGEAREHLGHAELTRQLWEQRDAE